MTNDPTVLTWIQGYKIPFTSKPIQTDFPKNKQSKSDICIFQKEIDKLLCQGAISKCTRVDGDFLSSIFLVPKANGENRFILNLKKLNKFINPPHFKMEDLRTAVKLVSLNSYLASVDLKDAYFLVPIHPHYKKYLRFLFLDVCYEFNCLPFGLNTAPLVFTKIMKPVVEHLRLHGWLSTIYLDDILIIGKSYSECLNNVKATITLLERLGFIINYKKSSLEPKTNCKFLGFIIDTQNYCVRLPHEKCDRINLEIDKFKTLQQCRIREFAKFIGLLISVCPAIEYSWTHTKIFEREKFLNLENNHNYDGIITLRHDLIDKDLQWWSNRIYHSTCPIRDTSYDIVIFSDASKTGWGACWSGNRVNGYWTSEEKVLHINILELLAAFFALRIAAKNINNTQILFRIDNTTAIACINRMGSVQYPHLHKVSQQIWDFCEERHLFIYASYIKSSENYIADFESRKVQADTEWELAPYAFTQILNEFGLPQIDLFASRSNAKCDQYISWRPDPYAVCIDAFTLDWSGNFFYAFPPFAIILKALNKVISDKAVGIMVIPHWPTQPWFPVFMRLVISKIIYFEPSPDLLISDDSRLHHGLHKSLTLAAAVLSGKHY